MRIKDWLVSLFYKLIQNNYFIYRESNPPFSQEKVNYKPNYDLVVSNQTKKYGYSFLNKSFSINHSLLKLSEVLVVTEYGVVLKGRRVILRTLLDSIGYLSKSGMIKYMLLPWYRKKVKYAPNSFFHLCGNMTYNYFHFLIDSLPRIIDFLELKKEKSHFKLLVNFPKKFTMQYLIACGVSEDDVYFLKEDLLVRELYISNNKFVRYPILKFWAYHVYSKNYLVDLIKLINGRLSFSPTSSRFRIYISREDVGQRTVKNEVELIKMLERYGVWKIVLNDLSILEQVKLFSQSEFIIGAHGAGFSNILFSRDAVLIELFPMNRNPSTRYPFHQIAQIGNNKHVLFEVPDSDEFQNLTVDVVLVEKIIRNYF